LPVVSAEAVEARPWIFGPEAAARFIAATSWPFERTEYRDEWALRLITEPDMLAQEATAARERLEGAINTLGSGPADGGVG